MDMEHHLALFAGYGAGLLAFVVARRAFGGLWPAAVPTRFARPWRELGLALVAVVGVLGIGQLWQHGLLLAEQDPARTLRQAVNQVLIFLPIPLLLIVRGQGPRTAWLPPKRVPARIAVGLGVALIALGVFQLTRGGHTSLTERLVATFHPAAFDRAVQVFLEDVAIAVLMVRFGAALRRRWLAVVVVGLLFAAGHLPAMITAGTTATDVGMLGLDALLAVAILGTVQRSADVWWFFVLHFTMDMTQFQA